MRSLASIASWRAAGLIAGVALLAAACTAGSTASPSAAASAGSASAAASAAASAGASGGAVAIATAQGASVGTFLTGANGMTLYENKNDSGGKSSCTGTCATNWPPLTVAAGASATAGSGVTGTLGTITRDDGSTQVTYNGAPLYYYKGDQKAGDTNGQGIGGVWSVASASGTGGASPSATSSGSSGGGYGG